MLSRKDMFAIFIGLLILAGLVGTWRNGHDKVASPERLKEITLSAQLELDQLKVEQAKKLGMWSTNN